MDAKATAPNRYDGPEPVPGAPGNAAASGNPAAGGKTVTIIDGTSGKRQEVPISGTSENAAAVRKPEPRLLEKSRHGEIPRIGEDGARPSEIYARAAKPKTATADMPRVAHVVGGLGVGASSTAEALASCRGP